MIVSNFSEPLLSNAFFLIIFSNATFNLNDQSSILMHKRSWHSPQPIITFQVGIVCINVAV